MLELFREVFAPPRDLILLIIAGWVGLWIAERRAKRTAVSEKAVDTLVGTMALAFLVGGRLFYAAGHLPAFISSPASLVSLNVGLFDSWGALASAAIAAAIAMQRRRLPGWQSLDQLTPFFAAVGIGMALSHLASGAAFGRETNLPWAITLWGAQRHPTQVYELIASSIALVVVLSRPVEARPGTTFLLWVALAAGSRLITEGFRGDSTLIFGGLRLAQIASWAVLGAALVGLEILQRANAPAPSPTEAAGRAKESGQIDVRGDDGRHTDSRKHTAP